MKERLQAARTNFIAADRMVFAYKNHRHELADVDPEAWRKSAYEDWLGAVRAFNAGRR